MNNLQPPQPTASPRQPATMDAMFSRIVRWYDPLNRLLSLGLDQSWRRKLADEALTPGAGLGRAVGAVADLAAGTLDVTMALRSHPRTLAEAPLLAVDICPAMLLQGRRKLGALPAALRDNVTLVVGDTARLPLPDASVDSLTMAFGIRNMEPRSAVFAEMLRVLTPGGKACILECGSGKSCIWKGLYNFYLERFLPKMGSWLSGDAAYGYLSESIRRFPLPEELAGELREAGFVNVRHTPLVAGIMQIHVGEKDVL